MKLVLTDQYANLLLLLNGLAIIFYLGARRKNRSRAMKFGNYETLQKVAGKNFLKSSNIVLITRLGALTLLMIGLSSPALVQEVTATQSDYVLAIDSSASMLESDIDPTRFQASKRISKEFVGQLGNSSEVGVVSFSGSVSRVQEPTPERGETLSAIDSVEVGSEAGTAIGSAIAVSSSMMTGDRNRTVVLITDGRNNAGISINESLNVAKSQEVTVHAIGLGKRDVDTEQFDTVQRQNASKAAFPNLDTARLRNLSEATGGEFTTASNTTALRNALIDLEETEQRTEISRYFVIAAAALLLLEWVLGNTKYSILP